ncbi:MAG: hypothetical protein IJ715_05880 [Bacilli bacterium]|nr:hypothetical protein [Bacilli bacterium]
MKITFKVHPFFYIFAFICIITGYFKNFLIISFIIIFHETGHIIASILFNWKIDRVILLPFGGITIFNEYINRPLKEEFIIAITGPLFQSILFLIDNNLFRTYNLYLLIFNLIPIIPLDGSKILNIFLNKFLPFKMSHIVSIIISFISLSLIFFIKFNLIIYIALIILFIKSFKELIEHNYLFNKFLLERYMNNFKFYKSKIVSDKIYMKRDYKHLFKINNKYIEESVFLLKLFDKS